MRRRGTVERCSRVALASAVIGLSTCALSQRASAQQPNSPELELAERYAPVVFVRPQEFPCDPHGERFEPAAVDIVLDNPEVFLRQVGNDDPVAMRGPTARDIFDLREGWYLDFPGDALAPGCVFEQDFHRFFEGESVVYAHVVDDADRPGYVALQYWFFWYHNPAKNDHEGDWEFIQLLFQADSVEQALTVEPAVVGYAQHTGGERSTNTSADEPSSTPRQNAPTTLSPWRSPPGITTLESRSDSSHATGRVQRSLTNGPVGPLKNPDSR